MRYAIEFTRKAQKDFSKLTPKLQDKCKAILEEQIAIAPYSGKELSGDLKGFYSIRLTFQDRILYTIDDDRIIVTIVRAKTHYGD